MADTESRFTVIHTDSALDGPGIDVPIAKFVTVQQSDGKEDHSKSSTYHVNSDAAQLSKEEEIISLLKENPGFDSPTTARSGDDSLHDDDEDPHTLHLYRDDITKQSYLPNLLSSLVNYTSVVPSTRETKSDKTQEPSTTTDEKNKKPIKPKKKIRLGTLMGVYLPCLQNIFGVILFLRMTWIVGNAGMLQAFIIVFICCCTTFLTAISMSAIATNGVVPAGGAYFMISRALGPEFGGAVGILFYLGTTFAASMYILGAVEILVIYIAPAMSIFELPAGVGANTSPAMFNNMRIYGTALLSLMSLIVFIGVKYVNKCASIFLFCVILSIVAIFVGIFVAPNNYVNPDVCYIGERIISEESWIVDGTQNCSYEFLKGSFCVDGECDPYFESNADNVHKSLSIPGISAGIFMDNFGPKYRSIDEVDPGVIPEMKTGYLVADMTTSFMILIGIFFPSVTGIMAGSNRSGDLADAQKSIPIGTIAAILTTSFVYLSSIVFFAATIDGHVLEDKFGESVGGNLIVALLAWPNKWVILIGSLLSTIGAGLQSLTGAPRLLQAIAQDGTIPFLRLFGRGKLGSGEPTWALLLTALISEIGILIASLDAVTPIITMFFLMCYMFVNMACALQTVLKTPNWRPRFRFYHWLLSLLGMLLCIGIMFISSWYYALAVIAIAVVIYKYIEFQGAEKEWGDGIRGLALSAARYSLLKVEDAPPHTKNFRPQLLVLTKLDSTLHPLYPQLLDFTNQLKAGSGLVVVGSVVPGDALHDMARGAEAKNNLKNAMATHKVKGFSHVVVSNCLSEGLSHLIQIAGLGGMKHNTVVMGWPYGWRQQQCIKRIRTFVDTLRIVSGEKEALLIPKSVHQWPNSKEKQTKGTMDIWWIVSDGGLLILTSFLLLQHKVWRNCRLRLFTVAHMQDNSIHMKKDLLKYLYQLRIQAEVQVVEMESSDISAYTYEKTLMMEQRTQMLKQMHLSRRESRRDVQIMADTHRESFKRKRNTENHFELKVNPPSPHGDRKDANNVAEASSASNNGLLGQSLSKPTEYNVKKMDTAIKMNQLMREKSGSSNLIIVNLPPPPKTSESYTNYLEFIEVLTEGLEKILLVRGGGREVVTIFS